MRHKGIWALQNSPSLRNDTNCFQTPHLQTVSENPGQKSAPHSLDVSVLHLLLYIYIYIYIFFFFFFFFFLIYLTVLGFRCWHLRSNSLTRNRTQAPCIGTAESQPLDHQGSPSSFNFNERRLGHTHFCILPHPISSWICHLESLAYLLVSAVPKAPAKRLSLLLSQGFTSQVSPNVTSSPPCGGEKTGRSLRESPGRTPETQEPWL